MPRGGKREGAGRPSEFTEAEKGLFFKEALDQFTQETTAALPAVTQAILDLAKGARELRYVRRSGRERLQILKEEEAEDGDGEKCWLYTLLPDKTAALAVIEHTKGRAAQTARVELDTTINLVHQIPRAEKKAAGWEAKYDRLLPEDRAKP